MNKLSSIFRHRISVAVSLCLLSSCALPVEEEANSEYELHPDFEMTLVASEPLVMDPVDLEFDENGDAYVLEMPGYPFGESESRLVRLIDEDGDGVFDQRQIYGDSLGIASSFLPYRQGFLVAAPPYLLYLKDTDGDGKADQRSIEIEGFTVGNTQHNYNGLTYGLDNWVYAADGGNSGTIYWPGEQENAFPIRYNDIRFKLESRQLERIGRSSGGFELAMDDWGRIYETHNLEHISHLVFSGRYTEGLAIHPKHTLLNISGRKEGELYRIYPIGKQDTRVNHPEQSGYFSGSCGITHYGGGAFGDEFNGNIFVADVVLNLIHRDQLSEDGTTFSATRGRERVEFLAFRDRAFRPVNMATGPDGALYVLDFHRPVIEHPEWIPDEIEKNLNIYEGQDQGRIYRIAPKSGLPKMDKSGIDRDRPEDVMAMLGHSNQWWRMTAQRILVETKAIGLADQLAAMVRDSENPLAQLHALRSLEGMGVVKAEDVKAALKGAHPGLRENALMVAEAMLAQEPEVLEAVIGLAEDPNARVRMQVALSLSTFENWEQSPLAEEMTRCLLRIAQKDIGDPWTQIAITSAFRRQPAELFQALINSEAINQAEEGHQLLKGIAKIAGQEGSATELTTVLRELSRRNKDQTALIAATLSGLSEGLGENPSRVPNLGTLLRPFDQSESPAVLKANWTLQEKLKLNPSVERADQIAAAKIVVLDKKESAERRAAYLEIVAFANFEDRKELLYDLLNNQVPKLVQTGALRQLWESRDPTVAGRLIEIWPKLGPEARTAAGNILLYQDQNHDELLTALEDGQLSLGEFNLHLERRRRLLWSEDEDIKKRAEALFNDAGVVKRKDVITQMKPALALQGKSAKGKLLYDELCSQCHQMSGQGQNVGPDLTEIFRKSAESLLHDILDPNAAVDTRYLNHTLETLDGTIYSGMVANENDAEVTLRLMGGTDQSVARSEIKSLTSTGFSLMPEGLESGLEQQDFADLLAFLQEPK